MTFSGDFLQNLPWLIAAVLAAVAYVRAWRRAARRGSAHPRWRLAAFLAGIACALVAVVGPVEHYGNQALWVDFLGFLLLTMIAAPLLVLGAPITLAFRVMSTTGRRRLRLVLRGPIGYALTFPVTTWLAFAVVTYTWQFSSLTDIAARHALIRDFQQACLLLVSLLFWAPAILADPLRWRMNNPMRALYVFVEMTHKGLFGGMFLSMNGVFHDDFAAHAASWAPAPIMDQRIAILVLWVGGNLVFLVALGAIVASWFRYERRNERRTDQRLERQRAAARQRTAALDQVFRRPV